MWCSNVNYLDQHQCTVVMCVTALLHNIADGHGSVKSELQSVMRPSSVPRSYSSYDIRATLPRRGRRKHRASTTSCLKAKRMRTFKNVNIIRYMGPNPPREFGRAEKDILCTFFYELNADCNGEEIMEDITRLAKQASVEGHDMSTLDASDLEFVKCAGKVCHVPQTEPGFHWSTEAIRTLMGHGDLYIRLRKGFDVDMPTVEPQLVTRRAVHTSTRMSTSVVTDPKEPHVFVPQPNSSGLSRSPVVPSDMGGPSSSAFLSSQPSSSSSFPPLSPKIDLTHPPHVDQSSSSEDEFPSAGLGEVQVLTKEGLYNIFSSSAAKEGIDEILCLCQGVTDHAFKVLLGGPDVRTLLQLKRNVDFTGHTKKLTIAEDDDLVEEAIVHYKHPSFNPLSPIRISFMEQPAIDTGGVTRQFFTDVLRRKIAHQGALQLFVGASKRLRLAYSPQVLPVMKILGTLIGHSLLHEGPGFPYLAPFVYWYIATGSEECALPYVSIPEDLSDLTASVVSEVNVYKTLTLSVRGRIDSCMRIWGSVRDYLQHAIIQLQQATSEKDFDHLSESSQFLQLMESSGCRRIPEVSKTMLGYFM